MVQRLLILVGLIARQRHLRRADQRPGPGQADRPRAAWPAPPGSASPTFAAPVFEANAMLLIAPVAIILVAENLGHIKAVTAR